MNGQSASTGRWGWFRRRFPWIVIGLAIVAVALLWSWPAEEFECASRVSGTWLAVTLAVLGLVAWLVLFSGLRWSVRLGSILALVGAGALVGSMDRDGDLSPTGLHFRWQPTPDEVLEAHRQQQPKAGPVAADQFAVTKPGDFPEYRNRLRDGVVEGPALARDWKAQPPRVRWRQPVGGGFAGFAVVGSGAFTIEQRRDQEAVVCYDTATGQQRWVHEYPAHFTETLGGDGPRTTPTVVADAVYSLGATGRLVCLDAASGAPRWSVEVLKDNPNVAWGMSGSPLVYDSVVVVNPGCQSPEAAGRALVAYDRVSGKEVWTAGTTRAGYSSPMLATLAGRRQILLFDGQGLGGFDAETGKELWRHPWKTMEGINVAQPLVLGEDRVFITSGYGVGCALLRVQGDKDQWSVRPVWQNKSLRGKFSSPVVHEGFLDGLDDGILVCLNAETGERKWKDGRYGHGQLLRSGGLLVILSEAGKLALVEATPEAHRELGILPVLSGKTWNCHALVDGAAFVRNHLEMACVELPR